jgi:FkbM family methyltransferase
MSRPHTIISYAQNNEDILLARILEPWKRHGHWIDVGAGHPTFDSVTRLFSDFGWTGINVEPLILEYKLLCTERTKDINLNCAIGLNVGTALLYEGPPESRGTSTLMRANAIADGCNDTPTTEVEVVTLASVIASSPWDIDFIKIDVEGMEEQVISSADWRDIPARVVVVEATEPNSVIPSHHQWEHVLLEAGYSLRLFDGLNRFYSCDRHSEFPGDRTDDLWYPATVQDNYETYRLTALSAQIDAWINRSLAADGQIKEMGEYIESLKSHLDEKSRSLNDANLYLASLNTELQTIRRALGASEAKRIDQQKLITELYESMSAIQRHVEELSEQQTNWARPRRRKVAG